MGVPGSSPGIRSMEEKPVLGYLFTSPTCPHCPSAKRFAEEYFKDKTDVEFYYLSTMDPEGAEVAKEFGIRSVPTFILAGPGKETPIGITGTPSEQHMNRILSMVRGND